VRLKEFGYEKGDLLVLYTDGIIEASSPTKELYGYERLEEFVRNNHQLTLTRFSDSLMEEIYAFTQTDSVDDDFTILLVKF
jgi:serine phosphatase RsbU (regulator of sigma subunit)